MEHGFCPLLVRPFSASGQSLPDSDLIFTYSNNRRGSGQDYLLLIKFSHNSLESFQRAAESSFLYKARS